MPLEPAHNARSHTTPLRPVESPRLDSAVVGNDHRPCGSVVASAIVRSVTSSPFRLTVRACTLTGAPAIGVPSRN